MPHVAPAAFLTWFVHTGVPELQSKVPGLQTDPQEAPLVQATHAPLPSQTIAPPQVRPAMAFFCSQTCVPVAQLFLPGLQVVPQSPPATQATQFPAPSQT